MSTVEEHSQTENRTFERRYDIDWLRIFGMSITKKKSLARFFKKKKTDSNNLTEEQTK